MPNRKDRRAQRAQERKARRTDTMGASFSAGGSIPEHIRKSPEFQRAAKEGLPPEYFAFIEKMAGLIVEWVRTEPKKPDLKWHQTDANRVIITGSLGDGAAYLADSPDAFRLLAWLDAKTERQGSIYQATWALRLCRALPMPDGSYYGVEHKFDSKAEQAIQTFARDAGKEHTRVPEAQCGHCGKPLDSATGTDGSMRAKPGDMSICIFCLGVNQFDERLQHVAVTADELAAAPPAIRSQLEDMIALLREAQLRMGAKPRKAEVEA
jgi:hypothetical protein